MYRKTLLALIAAAAFSFSADAATLIGTVTKISDGDTITVLADDGQKYRVRFLGIDAPESQQKGGAQSRNYLEGLLDLLGNDVTVEYDKKDKYGRILGKVMAKSLDLNLEQLESGHAWMYKQYANDLPLETRITYMRAEANAKAQRRGLWEEKNPTPPWEFRKAKRLAKRYELNEQKFSYRDR